MIDLNGDNNLPVIAAEDDVLRAEIKTRTERRKAIKAEFTHKMGPAAAALFQGGYCTAKTVFRRAYSVDATSYLDVRIKKGTMK